MTFSRVSILIMVLTLSYMGASGSVLAQAPDASRENLQQRVEQLESQMEAMRVELAKLRNELSAGNSPGVGERATTQIQLLRRQVPQLRQLEPNVRRQRLPKSVYPESISGQSVLFPTARSISTHSEIAAEQTTPTFRCSPLRRIRET